MKADSKKERLLEFLWPHGDTLDGAQVYAVLDGARDVRIESMLRQCFMEYDCLFAGRLSPRLRAAAPYVVHLARDADFTQRLLDTGWGQSWAVFTRVPADVPLQQQKRHFRTLLRVRAPNDKILHFRFYDPRVLRRFLPTCSPGQLQAFFGPIPEFVAEDAAGNPVAFSHKSGVLRLRTELPA